MIADGKVRVMVTLEAGLLGRLDAVAKVERKHRSTVLARAVEHYLEAQLRSGTAAAGEAIRAGGEAGYRCPLTADIEDVLGEHRAQGRP